MSNRCSKILMKLFCCSTEQLINPHNSLDNKELTSSLDGIKISSENNLQKSEIFFDNDAIYDKYPFGDKN